jgi:FAD/FMN-containing dehydrogenase
MAKAMVGELRDSVRGDVVEQGNSEYETLRKVHNAMIDRHPSAIVRPESVADIAATVRYAHEHNLDLAVRGGGHSVPGFGTCDDGIVLDLSSMRRVVVDPTKKTAKADGGATWGDFNNATHEFGLATTGGIISTTGVGGLTLGGGIGYLSRGCGLSCDNVISAEVVLADGSIVRASEDENVDLFWALRGGGGNFGVVTSFEFKLHPVANLYGGPIVYELDKGPEVMAAYVDAVEKAPEELGIFFAYLIAPPLPFLPESAHGKTFAALMTAWAGDAAEGDKVISPLFDVAPVVGKMIDTLPYPVVNSLFDELVAPGLQGYWKAHFATELGPEAIAAHAEFGPDIPTMNCAMHIYPINGACHRVGSDDTAFAHRDATYATVIAGMWPDPADNTKNTKWVRDYYDATSPFAMEAGYVNFMSADDAGRVEANYGDNFSRLADVKRTYDPDNVFHLNQNIEPR